MPPWWLWRLMTVLGRIAGNLEANVGRLCAAGLTLDACVMATRGRTGLARTIVGSIAGGVPHRASTAVVLVSPPELRSAEEPLVDQVAGATG